MKGIKNLENRTCEDNCWTDLIWNIPNSTDRWLQLPLSLRKWRAFPCCPLHLLDNFRIFKRKVKEVSLSFQIDLVISHFMLSLVIILWENLFYSPGRSAIFRFYFQPLTGETCIWRTNNWLKLTIFEAWIMVEDGKK